MNIRRIAPILVILLGAVCVWAEGTRTWEQSKFEEFEKGTAKGVAIRSDGTLELAPAFAPITTTPSTYLWSMAADSDGAVYLAAGSPARVYRVTLDGKTSVIFQPQELQVQSLLVASKDVIYAATSPDGKVYKLERRKDGNSVSAGGSTATGENGKTGSGWTASVFYEPKTKYIWDLALDREGRLYIATGDHGEIFRVQRTGEGELFFKSDEAHIRTLAFDAKGNLIAGSDGSGLIYRISPRGDAFVLYSAPKKEITALAVDKAGNIYAAGVGEKRAHSVPLTTIPGPAPTHFTGPTAGALGAHITPAPSGSLPAISSVVPLPGMGAVGSEIYEIAPDGSPKRIWSSRDEVVYALAFDSNGNLLAGTGNKGRVFYIQDEQRFTDLLKASANQVTAFARSPRGGLYVCTSNLGKLFLLGGTPESEGTYQSDVFDAHIFSRWGRAQVRGRGPYELWARSGNVDNPDRNWSRWTQVDFSKGAELAVPPARFVQWKAVLLPGQPAPVIDSVLLNYLPKNVAPVVNEVFVQAGARFNPPVKSPIGETVNVGGPTPSPAVHPEPVPMATRDRNSIAVRWTAHDDNDDQLVYSLYYRGDSETNWNLLKDKLTDKFYSFDAGLLPDGGYVIKVVASDAPSHSPEDALSDEHESPRFEVDTTPPRIEGLTADADAGGLRIKFVALDGFSVIKRAEFAVDAGEWQYVEPVGQLSDARTEDYNFVTPIPASTPAAILSRAAKTTGKPSGERKGEADDPPISGEHLVVVRVWDRFDNMTTAKAIVQVQ